MVKAAVKLALVAFVMAYAKLTSHVGGVPGACSCSSCRILIKSPSECLTSSSVLYNIKFMLVNCDEDEAVKQRKRIQGEKSVG